jgi:hypothetical protein
MPNRRARETDAWTYSFSFGALSKAHTWTAAVLVDEANPSSLQRFLHFYASFTRHMRPKPALEALNGRDR